MLNSFVMGTKETVRNSLWYIILLLGFKRGSKKQTIEEDVGDHSCVRKLYEQVSASYPNMSQFIYVNLLFKNGLFDFFIILRYFDSRGQRGNAVGFKLSSLTRIADTKSSCNKNMTLLHYIADTCEHKVRHTVIVTPSYKCV